MTFAIPLWCQILHNVLFGRLIAVEHIMTIVRILSHRGDTFDHTL
jgi:uncharacterized integral membrane protein